MKEYFHIDYNAQALLDEIGFEAVNPMEKGLPVDATWESTHGQGF